MNKWDKAVALRVALDVEQTAYEDEHRDVSAKFDRERWQTHVDKVYGMIVDSGLSTIGIGVADGSAIYALAMMDEEWGYFIWLYGGCDHYVSSFGEFVTVPLERAEQMVAAEKAMTEFFAKGKKDAA